MSATELLNQAKDAAPYFDWYVPKEAADAGHFTAAVCADTCPQGISIALARLRSGLFSASVVREVSTGNDLLWVGDTSETPKAAVHSALRRLHHDKPSGVKWLDVAKGGVA